MAAAAAAEAGELAAAEAGQAGQAAAAEAGQQAGVAAAAAAKAGEAAAAEAGQAAAAKAGQAAAAEAGQHPGVAAAAAAVRSAGQRIMLVCRGSRGDVQPLVAFGLALRAAGFGVRVVTNTNLAPMLSSFGLDAVGAFSDLEKVLHEDKAVRDALSKGDVMKAMKSTEELDMRNFPGELDILIQAVTSWEPQLLMPTCLCDFEVSAIAGARQIPCLSVNYQWLGPSKYQRSMIRERCASHLVCGMLVCYAGFSSEFRIKASVILDKLPAAKPFVSSCFREYMLQGHHPFTPQLVAFTPSMLQAQSDWTEECKRHVQIVGFFIVPEAEQQARAQQKDPHWGGEDIAAVEEFLTAGPAVYLGWGSVVVAPESRLACLAVRSLMQAGLRGIIAAGWAKLNPEMLKGQKDSEAMQKYASLNVLFIKSAPHEWLFPQCSAIVHHGGAGTTAAALRSGNPMVITPFWFDQFSNAELVEEHGVGVGLRNLADVKPKELAKALTRCVTDASMIDCAKSFGGKIRAEQGLSSAVSIVDSFLADQVATGRWKAAFETRRAELKYLQGRRNPGFFSWLMKLPCNPRPNDFSVKLPTAKPPRLSATE